MKEEAVIALLERALAEPSNSWTTDKALMEAIKLLEQDEGVTFENGIPRVVA